MLSNNKGNIAALIIVSIIIIAAIGVFTVNTYTTYLLSQREQQYFSRAGDFLTESLQKSIYYLMQRGYNNTREVDVGELWYCNAAIPPDIQEVNDSLHIIVSEELASLVSFLEEFDIGATNPSVRTFLDDDMSVLADNNVDIEITDFRISRESDDGLQTIRLDRNYSYDYSTWRMLYILNEWISCDAGNLSGELYAALNHEKHCLFDSCCCEQAQNIASWRNRLESDYGVKQSDIVPVAQKVVDRLNSMFDGAESCEEAAIHSPTGESGITCSYETEIITRNEVRTKTVPNNCEGAYSCTFNRLGSPAQLYSHGQGINHCETHRTPIPTSSYITPGTPPPASGGGSAGSDVNYYRIAIDKIVSLEVTVRCTDTSSYVHVDNRFMPLESKIVVEAHVENQCNIDAPSGRPSTSYAGYECLTTGGGSAGGPACYQECTAPIPPGMDRCEGDKVLTAICDGEQPRFEYVDCDEFLCGRRDLSCCGQYTLEAITTCVDGVCIVLGYEYDGQEYDDCDDFFAQNEDISPDICIPDDNDNDNGNDNGNDNDNGNNNGNGNDNGGTDPGPDPTPDPDPAPDPDPPPEPENPCIDVPDGQSVSGCTGSAGACKVNLCMDEECVVANAVEDTPCTPTGVDTQCNKGLCNNEGQCIAHPDMQKVNNNFKCGETTKNEGCSIDISTCQLMPSGIAECSYSTTTNMPATTVCRPRSNPSGNPCAVYCDGQGACQPNIPLPQCEATAYCGSFSQPIEGYCTTQGICGVNDAHNDNRACTGELQCCVYMAQRGCFTSEQCQNQVKPPD
ncbi:MAG: hypothetical protein ACMXYL_05105 [Candidatus Woesearchaeota archaeon]